MTLRINPRPCSAADSEQNWNAVATLIPQMQSAIDALAPTSAFPIGAVAMWLGTEAAIPSGWALCDGVANAVGLGGTGVDLIDVFVKFGDVFDEFTAAANTGSASPAVTISGSTAAASPGGSCTGTTDNASPTGTVSGTIGYSTTGITIASHSGTTGLANTSMSHRHNVTLDTEVLASPGSGVYGSSIAIVASSYTDPDHTHSFSSVSHSITEPNSGTGHTHSLSSASVTLSSHGHTFTGTISVASHTHGTGTLAGTCDAHAHTPGAPAHCTLLPIERLDP